MITDVVTAAATGALVVTGIGALYFARRQIDAARHDSKVDRTIDLHRDLTTGEVRLAKRRIAAMLWEAGEQKYGRRGVCQRPSFADFLPEVEGAASAGPFAVYPVTIGGPDGSRPLDDLYCLLEAYERLRVAWTEGTLVGDLVYDLFAHQVCWWSELLSDVTYDDDRGTGDTPHVFALHALAGELRNHIPVGEQDRIRMNFADPEGPDSAQGEPTSMLRRVDETT